MSLPLLLFLTISSVSSAALPPLQPGFYSEECPTAETTVRDIIWKAMAREARSGASVMRLQFHDCFVNVNTVSFLFLLLLGTIIEDKVFDDLTEWKIQGCDASLLLDDTPTMLGEKLSLSNINSLRSFEVIDEVKDALEQVCPGVVSCADIIVMAARDAVVLVSIINLIFVHMGFHCWKWKKIDLCTNWLTKLLLILLKVIAESDSCNWEHLPLWYSVWFSQRQFSQFRVDPPIGKWIKRKQSLNYHWVPYKIYGFKRNRTQSLPWRTWSATGQQCVNCDQWSPDLLVKSPDFGSK